MRRPRTFPPLRGERNVGQPRHGLARVLSRLGVCSRSEAERRIVAGRVCVNGRLVLDPETPADSEIDSIEVDGQPVDRHGRVYIAVNKPRGVVVSAADEHGRETVYALLRESNLPWLAPVGRLDKASEGLLLMSNDSVWAASITEPSSHVAKTYRVQVRGVPDASTLQRLRDGVFDHDEWLRAKSVIAVGGGDRNSWLEFVLDEGRNRQIRRMCVACGHDVLRLMRVAIGALVLGELPKGGWRVLTASEVSVLSGSPGVPGHGPTP